MTARAQLDALAEALDRVDEEARSALVEAIHAAPRVFVAGKGRSGLVMEAFANRLMHLDAPVAILGGILTPPVRRGDLVLFGSGSGRTPPLLAAAVEAQDLGASIALVTAVPESPIAEVAELVVRVPAPSPKAGDRNTSATHPLGTLFEEALWLLCDSLVADLMQRRDITGDAMFARHANIE